MHRYFLGLFVALGIGCGGGTGGATSVAERTLTLVDSSRATPPNGDYAGAATRTLLVELWYPTRKTGVDDPPPAPGRHPLVILSHGLMDNRTGESYLAEALAADGYVVAAPDYPLSNTSAPGGATVLDVASQPGDLSFVIDRLLADSTFGAALDPDRIGAAGLSLGGLTTLLAGYHHTLRDTRLKALFTMAAPACMFEATFFKTPLPLFAMHGDKDLIVPFAENGQRLFMRAPAPKRLAVLKDGTHTGFAGLASLLAGADHYDSIGCAAIAGKVSGSAASALGTGDDGIAQDPSACPNPCMQPAVGPVMSADRQQELVKASALHFFAETLRGDAGATTFLDETLAQTNTDLTLMH